MFQRTTLVLAIAVTLTHSHAWLPEADAATSPGKPRTPRARKSVPAPTEAEIQSTLELRELRARLNSQQEQINALKTELRELRALDPEAYFPDEVTKEIQIEVIPVRNNIAAPVEAAPTPQVARRHDIHNDSPLLDGSRVSHLDGNPSLVVESLFFRRYDELTHTNVEWTAFSKPSDTDSRAVEIVGELEHAGIIPIGSSTELLRIQGQTTTGELAFDISATPDIPFSIGFFRGPSGIRIRFEPEAKASPDAVSSFYRILDAFLGRVDGGGIRHWKLRLRSA